MVTWVITLLIGAVMIWMPERDSWGGFSRFIQFLLIVLILQLVLLHLRLYTKAYLRHVTTFTQIVTIVTIVLVIGLAIMLVLPLMLGEWVDFLDLYWRFVVALTILAAVGTALIPLINALFAPKKPRPAYLDPPAVAPAPALPPWPTYADGVTPLPVMPDGSPDWNAYYTGYPSQVSQAIAPVAPIAAPAPQWHEQPPSTPPCAQRLRGLPAAAPAAAATVAPASAQQLQCGHRRVVAADAAHGAAAPCARTAQQHARVLGRDTPARRGGVEQVRRPRPTATTAARGRCRRRSCPSDSSRSAVVRASTHGVPSGAS